MPMEYLDNLAGGLILSGVISFLAYGRGSLDASGVIGAIVVGTMIFGLGGWVWGLTLIVFFVTSSTLSHIRAREMGCRSDLGPADCPSVGENLANRFAKGHKRDAGQTLANGGIAALLALIHAAENDPTFFAAFLGAIAAVNADTWATELGVLSPSPPRLITNGTLVEVGTSGGVSRLGMLASMAGALTIGAAAFGFACISSALKGTGEPRCGAWMVVGPLLGGMTGSLVDSVLGAAVQATHYCPRCAEETEKTLHGCGTRTIYQRGWRWLNNDMVNLISSLAGAFVSGVLFLLW